MSLLDDDQYDALAAKWYGKPQSVAAVYRTTLGDSMKRARDFYGYDSTAVEARLVEDAEFFDAAQLMNGAAKLHALMVRHEITPADQATREAWSAETWGQLRDSYGDDAERRVATVNAFIRERPEVAQRLVASGMDQNPELVLALVENAHNLRITPVE